MPSHKLTPTEREFVEQVIAKGKKLGVRVRLVRARTIDTDGYHTLGHFDHEKELLLCAIKNKHWIRILAHESSHMDQWHEDCFFWRRYSTFGVDAGQLLWLWTQHKIELNLEQLRHIVSIVRDLEWDCEKRTIKKIKTFTLPVDVEIATQMANSYLFSQTMASHYRKWHFRGTVSTDKRLYGVCPKTFLKRQEYNHVPEAYRNAFIAKFGTPRP